MVLDEGPSVEGDGLRLSGRLLVDSWQQRAKTLKRMRPHRIDEEQRGWLDLITVRGDSDCTHKVNADDERDGQPRFLS